MKYIIKFIMSFGKSYRLARQCKGDKCLTPFQFHIWRWYKLEIEDLLKELGL